MDIFYQIADVLERLRQTGALAWPATLGLAALVLLTHWGANYASRNHVPRIVRDILEGLSNRDLSSRK